LQDFAISLARHRLALSLAGSKSSMTSKIEHSENRRNEISIDQQITGLGQTVLEPFLLFLRLGLTSFGGPIAHLGYFRQEFVERRKWLTEQTFGILLAALYQPIWTSAIDSARSLALALTLFAGLQIWKIAPWILMLIGGVVGGLFL
jgi:hypothetical protein